jgi:glycosyltransferase involved in cell wall biosynthesis
MVSVIITTYNYAQYVERAIRSALEQSLSKTKYEIIVVNDGSEDATAEVLLNYEDSCRIFNLENNIGLAAARNYGIKKARGQFVIFLDADDYLHFELLRIQRLFLTENNSFDAVSVDYFHVDERGKHLNHVSAHEFPIACGIMFRKDYLYHVGLYDESFNAREEEDLRIRWENGGYKIYNIPLPLYRYRMHDSNLTKDQDRMNEFAIHLKNKHGK